MLRHKTNKETLNRNKTDKTVSAGSWHKYAELCIWYKCLNSAELMVLVLFGPDHHICHVCSMQLCISHVDVLNYTGQFLCGNKRCESKEGLKSWEVNFAYVEQGEKRNALVKLRKCWRSKAGVTTLGPAEFSSNVPHHTCLEASSIQARPWWAASGVLDYGWS